MQALPPILLASLALLAGCASLQPPADPQAGPSDAAATAPPPAAPGPDGAPSAPDTAAAIAAAAPGLTLADCHVTEYMAWHPHATDPAWFPPGYTPAPWSPTHRPLFIVIPVCGSAVLPGNQTLQDVRFAAVLFPVEVPSPAPSPIADQLLLELYASPPELAEHFRSRGLPALDATIEAHAGERLATATVATADGPRLEITQSIEGMTGSAATTMRDRWHGWDGSASSPAFLDVEWRLASDEGLHHPATLQAHGGRLASAGGAPAAYGGSAVVMSEASVQVREA